VSVVCRLDCCCQILLFVRPPDIDDMQFGFVKGKGTTDAIFIVRQMQEKFRAKGKKLYFGFVDLGKAFDRILPNSVFEDPLIHFHSMFQQFNSSVRSTLHLIPFPFVNW